MKQSSTRKAYACQVSDLEQRSVAVRFLRVSKLIGWSTRAASARARNRRKIKSIVMVGGRTVKENRYTSGPCFLTSKRQYLTDDSHVIILSSRNPSLYPRSSYSSLRLALGVTDNRVPTTPIASKDNMATRAEPTRWTPIAISRVAAVKQRSGS